MSAPALLKTCKNCAAVKLKCHPGNDYTACTRCCRLGKDCIYAQARRRDNKTRSDPRIDALEAKVDQLLSASEIPCEPHLVCGASANGQSDYGVDATTRMGHSKAASSYSQQDIEKDSPKFEKVVAGDIPLDAMGDDILNGTLSYHTADMLVTLYKSDMMPYFPFVIIPPSESFHDLRRGKPALLQAMLFAASHHDALLQRRLSDSIKETISQRMILNGEVSFDLLQALLVYLAWSQYHPRPRRYSQFLQLAISIVVELRLDQPIQFRSWKTKMLFTSSEDSEDPPPGASWNNEQQRAFAGCFYLSSSISTLLQKLPTFPYPVYLETICQSLIETDEFHSDKYLSRLVQLQHIMEKTDRLLAQHKSSPIEAIQLHFTALRSELCFFQERLPFHLPESCLLTVQFYTAELFLCQIALINGSHQSASVGEHAQWPQWRLEALSTGLIAASTILKFSLSLPEQSIFVMNNTQIIQIGFAALVGAKMIVAASNNEAVFHETESLRQGFDLSKILEDIIRRFDRLKEDIDKPLARESFMWHYRNRIASIQKWLRANTPDHQTEPSEQSKHVNIGDFSDLPQMRAIDGVATDNLFFHDWASVQGGLSDPMLGTDFDASWMQGFSNPNSQ